MTKLTFVKKDDADVKTRKKELRVYMKEKRGDNANRDVKERLLVENLLGVLPVIFDERAGACTKRNALVYLSFSSEAPTDKLIQTLKENGYEVYCPRIDGDEMHAVRFGEDLSISRYGIREPIGEPFDGEIDVAVLPLLAVDGQGNRLGYGKGFYDRWLAKNERTKRIGYCFDFQVITKVPSENTDQKLDAVVTDKKVFFTERNG